MDDWRILDRIRIDQVHLRVSNLEQALEFYGRLLGFRLLDRSRDRAALSATGQPPAQIVLCELPGARPRPRGTTGLYHVAIRLPGRAGLA